MKKLFQVIMASMAGSVLFQCAAANPTPELPDSPVNERLTLLEAVRETLRRDTRIRLTQQQVEAAKGAVQAAGGQFDTSLVTAFTHGWTHLPRSEFDFVQSGYRDVAATVSDISTYELRLRKQFRSGITISPGLELNRFADNLNQERALNRANVSFLIRVPLLRGFGRTATQAQELAAQADEEAAMLDLQHMIASRILNTVTVYWQCLASARQLEVWRDSEVQSGQLVKAVQELVGIGELPASELRQSEADYAAKKADQINGEDQFWQSRLRLALALGMAVGQIGTPPRPVADFPEPTAQPVDVSSSDLLTTSLERRSDYRSARKLQRAAEILEAAARQNLKPQLDFNLEAGYAGLEEGSQFGRYFGSLSPQMAAGPNLMGTISLEWPFRNQTARGLLQQRQAAQERAEIRVEEMARTIHAGISSALAELKASFGALQQAEVAAQKYAQAVQSERDKVRLRTATILDVITLTDRLHIARHSAVLARANHAIALARYRFENGTIVQAGATVESTLNIEDLTTVSRSDRAGRRP